MKPILTVALAAILALPAAAALKPGDAAPDFQAQAALAGKVFPYALKDARAKGPVVVYFYPSAYTQGCNVQAHTFAANADRFAAAGASIVGVSLDGIGRLAAFSADPDTCAGKIPVASDADGRIAAAYALQVRAAPAGRKDSRGQDIDHGLAERTTFIVARDGRIVATLDALAPIQNVEKALEVVEGLAGARR